MTIDDDKLCNYLEDLCNRGCVAVREVISQLETGNRVPEELTDLDRYERQRLLRELKTIMAVYDARHYH